MMATAKKATEKVTDQTKKVTDKIEVNSEYTVFKAVHSVFQAGIGVLVLGKEELESAIDYLVEKGEVAEHEGLEKVGALLDRGRTDVGKGQEKVEGILDERIETVLNTMNIPSKSEIDSLTRKINNLNRKVNRLNKKVDGQETTKKAA